MQTLTLAEQQQLDAELEPGESIEWTGKPNPKVIFHSSDLYLVPFSLLWGGFAIFWEFGATGHIGSHNASSSSGEWFMGLWGVPFIVIGQYLIWGRFVYASWLKSKVLYAVTNRRVLTLVLAPRRRVISSFLSAIPTIEKDVRIDGIGTVRFGTQQPFWGGRNNQTGVWNGLEIGVGYPVFTDIDDADAVSRIVSDLRRKSSAAYSS